MSSDGSASMRDSWICEKEDAAAGGAVAAPFRERSTRTAMAAREDEKLRAPARRERSRRWGEGAEATRLKQSLDLETLNAADVDPETGVLLLATTDLSLGKGVERISVARTWRELDGSEAQFGPGWTSNFSARLEGLGEKQLCYVDGEGHRRWFLRVAADRYEASRGMPARVR